MSLFSKPGRLGLVTAVIFLASFSLAQTQHPRWAPVEMQVPDGVFRSLPMGPKSATDIIQVSVSLPFRNPVGIQKFVDSVSDPASPNYRQFLTPKQVGERFGPSATEINRVATYLASNGLKVSLVADNRTCVVAQGSVAQVQNAFNTTIEQFTPIVGGQLVNETRFSYTTPPSLPMNVTMNATYIGGLDNFIDIKPQAAITPTQMRVLYNLTSYNKGFRGKGLTVGITNYVGYRLSNVKLLYKQYGLPTPLGGVGSNIIVKAVDGTNVGSNSTENGEGDIDIEAVLAMAPLCTLIVYDLPVPNDAISIYAYEANDNKADFISESYGINQTKAFYAAGHTQHLAMSAQGITYLTASGDKGTSDVQAAPWPRMDTEVLVVGGTTATVGASGLRVTETGWSGSGGGWATIDVPANTKPSYQSNIFLTDTHRAFPDVALDADPNTGYSLYVSGSLTNGVGGTSCSSPTMAGALAACANQIIAGGGLKKDANGKQRFGRIQDLLYYYGSDKTVFTDIVSGANGDLPDGNKSFAAPGWDSVTGWGVMNFAGFVNRVMNYSTLSKVMVSPTSVTGGSSATGAINLNKPSPFGGTVVTITSGPAGVTAPATVTIPAGSSSGTFTINTTPVVKQTNGTILASANSSASMAGLTIKPAVPTKLVFANNTVVGGATAHATVTISGPAPAGGLLIDGVTTSKSAVPLGVIKVPAGQTQTTFDVTTYAVLTNTPVKITARANGVSVIQPLTVVPASLMSLTVSPSSVRGGGSDSVTGTVLLDGPAPARGAVVTLTSSNPSVVTVPATVTVAGGALFVKFPVTTSAVASSTDVTITASYSHSSKQAVLTVTGIVLTDLSVRPATVKGNSTTVVTGTVTLSAAAPAGGVVVAITSSQSTLVTVPATVTVPAGATFATFTVNHYGVTATINATISATLGLVTKTAPLSVTQ